MKSTRAMKRATLLLAAMMLLTVGLNAQWRVKPKFGKPRVNNVTFALQGGGATLLIDKSLGQPTKMGFGAGADVGYTYLFSRTTGIHTGLGASYLKSGFSSPSVASTYQEPKLTYIDDNTTYNGLADIQSTTASVEENYSTLMVEVPIQLAYLHQFFWANVGVRLAMPISVNANYTYGPTSRGITYFHETEVSLDPALPLGSDYDVRAQSGSYTAYSFSDGIKLLVSLDLEGGYRIPRGKDGSLYVGAYINYALNSISSLGDQQFVSYQTDEDTGTETALFAGALRSSAVSSFKNLSAGVKVYYNISFGRRLR